MPEPNELLRAARERTPSVRAPGEHMSRSELAERVCAWLWETTHVKYDLDGHYLAKLERGAVRWPGPAYRSGLRHVLNVATDIELGFSPSNEPAQFDLEPAPPPAVGLDDDLIDAGDESVSLLMLAEESNVGELTVEQLHADIHRIAQSYLKVPTRPLFLRSKAIRDRAFKLLAGRQPPKQTRELYAVAGWSLTTLAWMSVDLGRPDVAESHTRTAWACADAADHDELRAWVRATQHTAAFWQDDFVGAAEFARDGLRYAEGSSVLFLSGVLVVDLARSGRTTEARDALSTAKNRTGSPWTPEIGGPFLCTPERTQGIWSDAHLALGQPELTLELAEQSLQQFAKTPHAQRNYGSERMVQLQLAKAHLELGQLDGATAAVEPVLAVPAEYRVRPLLHRITEVAAQVRSGPYGSTPEAKHLYDAIRDYVRRPTPRRRRKPATTH
ncbi:hypothetical protein Kfla_6179 [Kribbella flavida DSM 17836]|uniref:XRE family transcriptional regulator n=1 Tax=Kribbella flavida (strain DSM 17836 / JCM 10339 / NBRC 14399) TaxID=479435 RepID=D2PUD1_KRIFD|nr:hypothetical protein [Kribbella flavida]ADB35182.1 hypothetical protein Kfla_6179 [Kribbella flavida DSM 17836]